MRFPANCLIVALFFGSMPAHRIRAKRNRLGRWHFYWTDPFGQDWEFYRKGASRRNYFQNALYIGQIRRCK